MKKAAKDAKEKKKVDEEIDVDPVDDDAAKAEADAEQSKGLDEINTDAFVNAGMEKLAVDMGAELSGWAGRPTSQLKDEQERELAAEAADEVEEQVDS